MAKKGVSKKACTAPPKTIPHPADFRPLGSYCGILMRYVVNEHAKMNRDFKNRKRKSASKAVVEAGRRG